MSGDAPRRERTGSVSLRGITKRFGGRVAVDDLSLEVEPGEFLTLLGPSGCGKTTTLRTIAGLEEPDAGSVQINGEELTHAPANMRPVNTVFQSYALFPHLSVYENIAFGLRRRRLDDDEIQRHITSQLDMMGLRGYEDRRPHQLSGGEQQRVAIARALVLKPAVLLLDEPFASLDFKLRQRLQIELKTLQRETGISFIMVTHDQNEALAMSDRIAVMNQGRVEQLGGPIEVYQRPATPFVASFLGDANLLEARLTECGSGAACADVPGVGLVRGSPTTSVSPGSSVQVFVRPEYVSLTQASNGATEELNCVDGVLEATVIVGGLDRKVLVRLDNGALLESLVRAGSQDLGETGVRVAARWPISKTLIYGHAS